MVTVTVKWNAQKFENVSVDTTQPPLLLKTQLFSLTNVPVHRQKIIIKGVSLKDDDDLSKIKLKQGQTIMLMGTADELPKAPLKQSVFLEDMDDSELAKVMQIPSGLANLGNTCYMAATLQCLRAIPELQVALEKTPSIPAANPSQKLLVGLRDLFRLLKNSSETVHPLVFVQLLRQVFPRFGESNANGFLQQDAEECWGELVSVLRNNLNGVDDNGGVSTSKKWIEQYMMGELTSVMKSSEAPDEQPTISVEPFTKLNINIGAGVSTYMIMDLTNGLTETLTKNSPTLNRSLTYTKTTRISRLPYYLVTSFVRFQWKPSENVKAKILKRVKFPFELDVFSVCCAELQEDLKIGRARVKELDDKKAEMKKSKKPDQESTPSTVETPTPPTHATLLTQYKALSIPPRLADDIGANVSGHYELCAVLTHVGRTAESGHYIAWTKNTKGEWWKFDDDKVSMVNEDEITKLEGGGDWHTAYICLYKARGL